MKDALNIVVGMDLGAPGLRALREGLRLAHARPNARVHVIHAVPESDALEQQERALERLPGEIWQRVHSVLSNEDIAHDAIPVWQHVRIGEPASVILQVANDYEADLVVVGSNERRTMGRLLIGSVAETLVREAVIPVLVAHDNRLDPDTRTERPAEAPAPGEVIETKRRPTHIYTSTLIDAWGSIQRSSMPFS